MSSGDDAAVWIFGGSMHEAEQKRFQLVNERELGLRMPGSGEYRQWPRRVKWRWRKLGATGPDNGEHPRTLAHPKMAMSTLSLCSTRMQGWWWPDPVRDLGFGDEPRWLAHKWSWTTLVTRVNLRKQLMLKSDQQDKIKDKISGCPHRTNGWVATIQDLDYIL